MEKPRLPLCLLGKRGLFHRCPEVKRWSGWQDLNLRPRRPERRALATCATPRDARRFRGAQPPHFRKPATPLFMGHLCAGFGTLDLSASRRVGQSGHIGGRWRRTRPAEGGRGTGARPRESALCAAADTLHRAAAASGRPRWRTRSILRRCCLRWRSPSARSWRSSPHARRNVPLPFPHREADGVDAGGILCMDRTVGILGAVGGARRARHWRTGRHSPGCSPCACGRCAARAMSGACSIAAWRPPR